MKLAASIQFLATANSYADPQYSFRVHFASVCTKDEDVKIFGKCPLKPGSHGVNLRLSCLSAPKNLMLDTIDTV